MARPCEQCGKPRDDGTGRCPTPDECGRLRAPHKRLREEAARVRESTHHARVDATRYMDVTLAAERSRASWAKRRR